MSKVAPRRRADPTANSTAATAPADADFTLDRYVFNVIAQIELAYRRQVQAALRPLKVPLPVWRTLGVLREHDGCTVTELADRTVTERTALTRVLQQMEQDGLIRREVRADDRRAQGVFLTAKGHELLARVLPVIERVYRRVTLGATDDELTRLVAALTDLRGRVR